jgi:tetratricopeptide (TPR) repeat protein
VETVVEDGQDKAASRTGGNPAAEFGGQARGLRAGVPRQLPPPTRHFVGRAEPLKELSELLDQLASARGAVSVQKPGSPGAAVISVISGTAGVGKTTLALYWAHRVADRFPDGQLYVNLRGFDPSGAPVEPDDAARSLLEALGLAAERVPPAIEARLGLLRSTLAGKRMLILLDNASDAGQVRPLLTAAPGCLTLITSRNQLTSLVATHGAQMISLDVLSAPEATELLERQLGLERVAGERDAVTALTGLCARLPLALAIIAARAAVRRNLPLAALVAELRDDGGVLDALHGGDTDTSIRAVFSWSYRQLSEPAARMFRLLGAHPGPDISRAAAASLAELTPGQADRVLTELTGAHLLTEFSPGRFAFHDLLRAYAAELARDDSDAAALEAARLRALDHYLQTGFAAALLLEPHRMRITLAPPRPGVHTEPLADYHQALAWFQAEHRVMLAAVSLAANNGHDRHTWQLAWTLSDFLDWRGHWHDWLNTQEIALAACRRLGDAEGQGHAQRSIARACNQLGRYDETMTHLDAALDLYGACGDALGQARCHIDMAAVLERLARYDEAIDHAEQGLQRFRAAGHSAGEANALNAVGWCNAMAGHHTVALDYCTRAIELQRQIGDKHSEAATWDSVGFAHHHLGQYDEAIACYRRALGFYVEIGHRHSQAETLSHLAETQQASGEPDAARQSWRQALVILEDLHHTDADLVRAKLTGEG